MEIKSKQCYLCDEIKPIEEFHEDKSRKDGHRYECKDCQTKRARQYYKDNPNKYKELRGKNKDYRHQKRKEYYAKNKEDLLEQNYQWRMANKERIKANGQKYWKENKDKLLKYKQDYSIKNKDKIQKSRKRYYQENKEKISQAHRKYEEKNWKKLKERRRRYCQENKEKISERRTEAYKKKRLGDPLFKLKCNVARAILLALQNRGLRKKSRTLQILGCSIKDFMVYLGVRPKEKVHLDHICPCAQAQNEQELLKLFHYTNLRWLLAEENLLKHAKKTPEGEAKCLELLGRPWIDKKRKIT